MIEESRDLEPDFGARVCLHWGCTRKGTKFYSQILFRRAWHESLWIARACDAKRHDATSSL